MHLDVQSGVNKELALEGKRGREAILLVRRHVALAKEHGDIRLFKKFASKFLFGFMLTAMYHGFKSDALEMVQSFPELFGFGRRAMVYILTAVPGVPPAMRAVYKAYQAMGLQKTLTRNYGHSEVVATVQKPKP